MSHKAKDMNALIRLHKWTVDEKQRELGVLQTRESQLIAEGQQLERQMAEERRIAAANPTVAGFLFGAFAVDYRRRQEELAAQLQALRQEIEAARDRLADAFRRLKVYEEVQKNRATQEKKEEAHKEQVILDEIGQVQHRMKTHPQ